MWSCDCLIIYSDRKSDDHTIDSSDDNNVIAEVSIRKEENSRKNITEEKNKDRKNKEENRIFFSSLKKAEREENIIFINREICWDNSIDNESINWL